VFGDRFPAASTAATRMRCVDAQLSPATVARRFLTVRT
jgi:hypothetical protein